jgi:hypothetical protein
MGRFFPAGSPEILEDEGVGANLPMIEDEEELAVTRLQLKRVESALASLRARPMHPDRLEMMSVAYIDYIDMLKARIQAYVDAHATSAR